MLYTYCHVLRTFNGDVSGGMEAEAAHLVLALSCVLSHTPRAGAGARDHRQAQGASAAPASASSSQQQQQRQQQGGLPTLCSEAVLGCLCRACQPPVGEPSLRPQAVAVLWDVMALLRAGGSAVILAVTHLQSILEAAAEQLKALEVAALGGGGRCCHGLGEGPECCGCCSAAHPGAAGGVQSSCEEAAVPVLLGQ